MLGFYEQLGFVKGAVVPGYYGDLQPPDAVEVHKSLQHIAAGQVCKNVKHAR